MQKFWIPICGAWALGTAAGFCTLWNYSNTPGLVSDVPYHLPTSVAKSRNTSLKTLVMFAHPRCPCTRASLLELETLAAQAAEQLNIHVYFYKPADQSQSWVETDLWQIARRIPAVRLEVDTDNFLASQFQATTSGHVLLYCEDGKLLYSGGITAARGHTGDSFGKTAVLSKLRGEPTRCSTTPVFGCSLETIVPRKDEEGGDDK